MNERLRELMVQADYPAPEIALRAQKLAELVVQECAELAKKKAFIIMQKAEEYAADKEEMINATSAAFHLEILEQEIRKHFGVEA